jgi:hypothetical protein
MHPCPGNSGQALLSYRTVRVYAAGAFATAPHPSPGRSGGSISWESRPPGLRGSVDGFPGRTSGCRSAPRVRGPPSRRRIALLPTVFELKLPAVAAKAAREPLSLASPSLVA